MNVLVTLGQVYIPGWVKKRAFSELFDSTAEAFRCPVPPIKGLSLEQRLRQYALFTQSHAAEALQDGGDVAAVQERLYENAYRLGARYRRWLRVRTIEDVMATGRILYRVLGIEFEGNAQGDVVIRRCFFSAFYSSEVCQVMSAMDRGVFAGLSGGSQLVFSARITEGHNCCQATLHPPAGL